jgi:hypothetical protein
MADPPDSGFRPPGEKRYDPAKVWLARLSWLIPLACLGITVFFNTVVRPPQGTNATARFLGAAAAVLFIASVGVGFVLAVVSLALSSKYRGVLGHAVGGLVTSVAFALLIVGMFWAVAKLRAILERQREGRPGVQQTAPRGVP